jgi:hypothetical protein
MSERVRNYGKNRSRRLPGSPDGSYIIRIANKNPWQKKKNKYQISVVMLVIIPITIPGCLGPSWGFPYYLRWHQPCKTQTRCQTQPQSLVRSLQGMAVAIANVVPTCAASLTNVRHACCKTQRPCHQPTFRSARILQRAGVPHQAHRTGAPTSNGNDNGHRPSSFRCVQPDRLSLRLLPVSVAVFLFSLSVVACPFPLGDPGPLARTGRGFPGHRSAGPRPWRSCESPMEAICQFGAWSAGPRP